MVLSIPEKKAQRSGMNMHPHIHRAFLLFCLFMAITYVATPSSASALTVNEVVKDLACPCECPLVLEDCNMTCGLEWKNEVGEMINKGMTKQQIMDYFIDKYGFAAGNDYELTSPRYYEVLHAPKPKIKDIILEEMKITNLSDLYVGTQYLRSEAKHKSIIWISALRDEIN